LKRLLLFYIAAILLLPLSAQHTHDLHCSGLKSWQELNADTYVADPALLNYDVVFYYLDLEANDTSTYLKGFTEMQAVVVSAILSEIVIELSSLLTVDSILVDGTRADSFSHTSNIIRVNLDGDLANNDLFTSRVYYHGSGGNNSFFTGISSKTDFNWDQQVTYTLSEPFNAIDWFACKQVLTDKADSAYVFITTDTSLMAGSNGLLTNVTELPEGKHRFEWKSNYPIAFYLLSLCVSDYQDYSLYAFPEDEQKKILIQNYIYDVPHFLDDNKEDIDMTADMIELFSDLYTMYPFNEEKYGHCYAPMGGGMEHQTMTTLSSFNFGLVAHELGHMWFGDNVTCATWQDIWINEGFASYTEYLALEYLISHESAQDWMVNAHDRARTEPEGSIYIPEEDATEVWRIFSGSLSYKKGAAIIHMLRYELDDDSVFFNVMRNFQKTYKNSVATGMDFLQVLEETSGTEYDWFFDQWYFGKGFPKFNFTWWQNKDSLNISSLQTGSSDDSPFFRTHMDFLVTYIDGTDTIIRLEQTEEEQMFQVSVPNFVSNVIADPENWVLDYSSMIKKPVEGGTFSVGPNPFTDEIMIEFNYANLNRNITISDMTGHVVGQFETRNQLVSVPVNNLTRGVYIVTVKEGHDISSTKIIKK